jgi:hypothetical protein
VGPFGVGTFLAWEVCFGTFCRSTKQAVLADHVFAETAAWQKVKALRSLNLNISRGYNLNKYIKQRAARRAAIENQSEPSAHGLLLTKDKVMWSR